jgi:predicted regulator of Ras-like GTPase activity (Roadblock/LC7/MglB family)
MSFQEQLAQIVDGVEGGLSCVLMSRDGLKIEGYDAPREMPVDSETYGIEYTGIFNQVYQVAKRSQTGSPQELVIHSDNLVAIFRFITEEYFVYLTLQADGNIGKGRFLLRASSPHLRQALA